MSSCIFVPFRGYSRLLTGGFEEGEDLLAFDRSGVDGPQVLLALHFPYRGDGAFFFDSLVRNVLGLCGRRRCFSRGSRRCGCRRLRLGRARFRFHSFCGLRVGRLYCFVLHQKLCLLVYRKRILTHKAGHCRADTTLCDHLEEPPLAVNAVKSAGPKFFELEPRARDEVLYGA